MSLWDRLTGNDQRKRLEEERRQLEVARQMSLRRAQQSSNPQVAQQATQKLNNGGWRLNAEPIETTAQAIGKSVYNAPKQVFNGAVNFVKPYAKSINLAGNMVTKGATVPFAAYDITKESLFGTDQSYQQKLNNYGNYLRTGGLGKTGGLLNAGTGITNLNEFKDPKKLVGSILETGTNLGSFVPTGKAWQASVSGTKAIKPLLTYGGGNAVVNMAGSAGTQLIETGKVDPKGLIAPAVAGIALPVAGYGLGRGAKPAFKPTQKPVNNPRAPKTTNTFDPKAEKEQYALRLRQYGSETKDPAERFRIGQELQRVSKAIADYDKKQGQGGFVRNPLVNDDGTSRLGKVDPLEALKAEARKYKSAEEFIKAQGEPLYHGSPNTEKITALKAHDGVEGYFGNGVYLTRNPEVASRFTKLDSASPNLEAIGNGNFMDINTGRVVKGGKPGVISATLPKDIKLKNITEPEMTAEIEKFRQPNGVIDLKAARNAVRDKYAKQGYDGFEVTATKYFDEPQTVIFPQSESKIKTKQQLTDIYNQNLNDQFNSYLNQATTSQNINPRTAMEFLNTYNNVLSSRIEKANLGRLSDNTSQMAKNAGIRITKNPEVVLETRYMKHLESEHRTGKPDKSFITDEDLARLPDVIFNPDRITNGGIKRGAQRALFEKSFDEYHTVVAEVIQRGDQISVVTYKKDPLNKVSQLSVTDRLDASMPQGNVSGKPPQGFSPNNTIPNKTNPVNPIRGFEKLKKLDKKQGQGGFVRNPLVNDDGTSRIGNPFAPKMVTPDGAVIPTRAKTPNVRSESVVPYKGREAVNIDEYITDTAPRGVDDRSFIRNAILGKFKNKRITLSNGNEATVGRNEAGKLSGKSYKEQLPEHLDTKLNSSMYIDELGVTVRNLRPDTNRKNFKSNAPSIEKGDITIISRGVPHEAELVIRKYPDGTYRIYDVIVPKENTPSRVGVSAEHRVIRGDSGDTIPTNTTNVNGLSTAPPVGKTAPSNAHDVYKNIISIVNDYQAKGQYKDYDDIDMGNLANSMYIGLKSLMGEDISRFKGALGYKTADDMVELLSKPDNKIARAVYENTTGHKLPNKIESAKNFLKTTYNIKDKPVPTPIPKKTKEQSLELAKQGRLNKYLETKVYDENKNVVSVKEFLDTKLQQGYRPETEIGEDSKLINKWWNKIERIREQGTNKTEKDIAEQIKLEALLNGPRPQKTYYHLKNNNGKVIGINKSDYEYALNYKPVTVNEVNGAQAKNAQRVQDLKPLTQQNGVFGTIWTKYSGRPKEAIKQLLAKKEGEVPSFVTRQDIGDIDLVYGKGGTDGYGLAHIAEKHPEVIDKLDKILLNGTVRRQSNDRLLIESADHTGVVRLDWNGREKQWVATAFENKNPASGGLTAVTKTSPTGNINDAVVANTIPTKPKNVNGLSTAPPVGKTAEQQIADKFKEFDKVISKAKQMNKNIDKFNADTKHTGSLPSSDPMQLAKAVDDKLAVDFAPVQKVQTAPKPLERQIVTTPRIGGVKPTNVPDLLAKFNRFNLSLLLLSVGIV